MVVSLKNVSMVSSKLLVTAKSVAADPSAPNARNQLAAAARWEHWLTNQTLKVICFLYCGCFHRWNFLFPCQLHNSLSTLSPPYSSSHECRFALPTCLSHSYLSTSLITAGSHGKLVAALLFPRFLPHAEHSHQPVTCHATVIFTHHSTAAFCH